MLTDLRLDKSREEGSAEKSVAFGIPMFSLESIEDSHR